MKKTMFVCCIIILLFTISCAGSPSRISMMSEDQLRSVNSYQLCHAYGHIKSEKVRNELLNRYVITSYEWTLIDRKSVSIGMSELALRCSLGIPNTINTTVTQYGTRK